ncbi:zinc ribbon domain-containing protein [Aidingimonas lacisalsi]|uniref:zinc ribbon domain-containing protein n=1 Tax=Aidingimonas lacisalsi TaxID=2604086 RepID=UPI0011D2713C|nr:zinc ribbon domain-containing protein [Aidingimonas lacisalsi]
MALIACPECEHQVSDTAYQCSQCGKRLRKLKRSFFGKLCKWAFILFNILMIVWLFGYWTELGSMSDQSMSDAEQTGAAIGGTLGTGLIITTWALGDIILGLFVLFTRPKEK